MAVSRFSFQQYYSEKCYQGKDSWLVIDNKPHFQPILKKMFLSSPRPGKTFFQSEPADALTTVFSLFEQL